MKQEKQTAEDLSEYRKPMKVTEVIIQQSPYYGETGYYVCPRCKVSVEREFMAFCDRCGQKLGWRGYRKAKKIYSGRGKAHTDF